MGGGTMTAWSETMNGSQCDKWIEEVRKTVGYFKEIDKALVRSKPAPRDSCKVRGVRV
ncbi:hypothetical protein QJS04_geneDACA011021 [Acorus gramineus]|uniref:Uncharacterized protein n=1 Tax=Acorus gramineus TaxID=55184 RepID=A0AAV9BHD9_ACOGR|nr:hypothetical protein QJS04_geneDACA011021 [Acorus gramineus]